MKKIVYLMVLATIVISCKKPYTPPIVSSPGTYLVVEGVINAGADSTIIYLSHTVNLSNITTLNPATKAAVTVESDQNASFPLVEIKSGKYISTGLNLDKTRQYRLRIKTSDNQQYLSDFVAVKLTPPIDSIGFYTTANGLQLYVNAHDAANNTRYYRWDFAETWKFHSMYASSYVTNGTAIVPRSASQLNFYCFAGDVSSNIGIGSSAALAQDVIYQAPLTIIPFNSEKLELRYSMLLHQYALTGEAYAFWENLKKNTEQLGSIFDAQPSTSPGNIHNVNDPNDLVIGYVSASTIQTKRIFITQNQLPSSFAPVYPYMCSLDTFFFVHPLTKLNDVNTFLVPAKSTEIPVVTFMLPGNTMPDGYLGSSSSCVDCTLRGTVTQPSFW